MELKLRVFKDGKMYGHTEAVRLLYNKTVLLEDEEFIIMLFTGLKDKNGKEIYEGDIIEFKKSGAHETTVVKIVFSEGRYLGRHDGDPDKFYYDIHYSNKKIIGNIHENPELL